MRFSFLLGGVAVLGVLLAHTRDANACGGCFTAQPQPMQPSETITVVTDHRMAFAVSPQATTLYDQIRYQGDPESFAWVLPITDTVSVGLSADVLFATLDALTRTRLTAPVLPPCPPPPFCPGTSSGGGGGCSCGAFASADSTSVDGAAGSSDGAFAGSQDSGSGVDVTKREVVGPYDTVQIKSTNPQALFDWFATNKFYVPDDIKPVIAAYQSEGFGFLALKLLPGKSVKSMRPVRITTPGAGLTLPLRMVAAGTGATVGVTLWVVSEGRYEPFNFKTFQVTADDLVWDWATRSSNYSVVRDAKTKELAGAGWEIESSLDIARTAIERFILSGGTGFGMAPATNDYLPVVDMQTMQVLETADEARMKDLDALLSGMKQVGRITRIRADLAHDALVKDLQLNASTDQTQLANTRVLTKDTNRPACPTYPPCPEREQARGGSSCSTTSDGASSAGLGIASGVLVLSILRRRRRR